MTVPSALPFYLAPAPLATGQEVGPEQHGSQAGASWQLAHNLEVWTWSLVPREQLSVWHFRSSCHLNRLLLVESYGGPGSFRDFWAGRLSGCPATGGCSRVVGARGKVGRGGSCFGLWKLGGNPDLGAGSWEVGFQSLCSSSSPYFVLVLSLAYVPFNLSSKCQDPENSSVDSDRK